MRGRQSNSVFWALALVVVAAFAGVSAAAAMVLGSVTDNVNSATGLGIELCIENKPPARPRQTNL